MCGYPPFFSNEEYERDHDALIRYVLRLKSTELIVYSRYPFWILFNDDSPYLRQSIISGRFTFHPVSWSHVTDEGMF